MKVGDRVRLTKQVCDRIGEDINGSLRQRRGVIMELKKVTRRFTYARVEWDNSPVVGMVNVRDLERLEDAS